MQISANFLKGRLSAAGITHAAVIDEAFDDQAAVQTADLESLWVELEASAEWLATLRALKITVDSKDKFLSDGALELWKVHDQLPEELIKCVQIHFLSATSNRLAPVTVARFLKDDLGIPHVVRGAGRGSADLEVPSEARIVFLDFDLEGETKQNVKLEDRRSVRIAQALRERRKHAPFLILFSSKDNLTQLADEFRKLTGYLRGTFFFMPKGEATDLSILCQRLSESCIESPILGEIQHFFLTISSHLKEVADKVQNNVMQLDVQDYAFLQRMALHEDGAPLGQYVLDLFGAVLSYELRAGEEVIKARNILDRLNIGDYHLPFATQPSLPIKDIYKAVLTEPGVGDAEPHPQVQGGKLQTKEGKMYSAPPLLTLGDIFYDTKNADCVYVILNPACDLQYSPMNQGRQPKLDQTVYLMKGILEPLGPSLTVGSPRRLEILQIDANHHRVKWLRDDVSTVSLERFSNWKKKSKLKRIARLNTVQALALQAFWISNLSRVGLPVSLPFYDACQMSLYYPTPDGKWKKVTGNSGFEAIVVRHPRLNGEPVHFTLTLNGCRFLYDKLKKMESNLKDQPKRKTSAEAILKDEAFWTNIKISPNKLEVKNGNIRCVIKSKSPERNALLCFWETQPKKCDITAFPDVALAIVLKPESSFR